MLHLHCGLPRTSTSSLQAALFEWRTSLADAGIVYPERWRGPTQGPAHHGLYDLLAASAAPGGAFDELRRFLAAHADEDVIFSAEGLSNWLSPGEKRDALLRFVGAAQEEMPVRCIWALRRHDEILVSMYVARLAFGLDVPPPAEAFDDSPDPGLQFDGMRSLEDEASAGAVYVKYDFCGSHNRLLLRGLGVPEELLDQICLALDRGPRLNARVGQKQIVALLDAERLAQMAGAEFDRRAVQGALRDGLEFEDDRRCEPFGAALRTKLHRRALKAARASGFKPYEELFAGDEIDVAPSVGLDPVALTGEDLRRLSRSCGAGRDASASVDSVGQ